MTSLHADDAFLNYYQFSHDPFTPRVPGFKFYPAQRKSVLGQLHHLARYGQLLLLVTGPKGSGKTLLRQALVASTNKQAVLSCVVSAREVATAAGVLAQVARSVESTASSLTSICARAGQLALTGQEVYLLVDDAELLDEQALEALLALAAGNAEGRMHVFLFAASGVAERLRALAGGDDGFHAIQLQPYTSEETRAYLAIRLEGAGQSLDLLTDEQLEDIQVQSGGWPGAINQVARETMIDSMLADRGETEAAGFSLKLPRKHLLALLVVGVGVCAAWFMNSDRQEGSVPSMVVDAGLQTESPQDAGPVVEFSASSNPQSQPAAPVIREPLAQASGALEADESVRDIQPAANASSIGEETSDLPGAAVPLPLPKVQAAPPASELKQADAAVAPANSTQPAAGAAPPAGTSQVVVVSPAETVVGSMPAPAPAPAASTTSPAVATASKPNTLPASPASDGWYRSQSPSRVALQILGTRSEANAKAFVQRNGGDYRYYMKQHQGAPMYVVTYGVFSSRAAAEAAIKSLPEKVRAGKPWPKTFASIQQEMSKGR